MLAFLPFAIAVAIQIIVLHLRFFWANPVDKTSKRIANMTTFVIVPAFVIQLFLIGLMLNGNL